MPVDRMLGGQGIASWYTFLGHTQTGRGYCPAGTAPSAAVDAVMTPLTFSCPHALQITLTFRGDGVQEFNASDQPAGVVAAHGTTGEPGADPLCIFALDCYLDTLGQEAANMAMRFLARGGVFIAGGGIAAKLVDRIQDGRVLKAYLDQGVSTEVVETCPLYVSDMTDMGMHGIRTAARAVVQG